jgi:NitT/TauT family transport system permease protein
MEFAQAYRLTRMDTLRHVVLPALLPHLPAAVCTAIGLAWKSGVAAEVLCLPKAAIGTQVYFSKLYLDTPALFAWTLVVVALSMTVERIARRLLLGRKGGRA